MLDFVHLHNHTHYSILDAACTPKDLVDAAVADGHKAIALTDHGVMFGCLEFYHYALDRGIKPIIGMEAYVASTTRFEKIAGKTKDRKHRNYYHLLLLAKDLTGYKNLLKLTTLGHTEGFYYKPRIDRELLEKYHDGLIASSACIGGVINAHLLNDEDEEAYSAARFYKDLFGDDFYVEIQHHNLPDDEVVLRKAPKLARDLGLKLVATNDIHYIKQEHAYAHNVLLYIKDVTAATSGQFDVYKLRYRTPEMYFKSAEAMNEMFKAFPEAISSTVEIADKCNLTFSKKLYMPEFPIPSDTQAESLADYLRQVTIEGLEKKMGIKYDSMPLDVVERIEYELSVINKMDFPGYFLIVWDFVKAAKELGVRVGPGRGSAAGSLVAYGLDITNVNPLTYDLLFERFLNPDRATMPDIDIDFSDDKREKVIEYVRQKYGSESVAMIITFGKMTTKAVITDVGRVLGVPLATVREITKKIPVVRGKVTPLAEAIKLPELKWIEESEDQKIMELISFCTLLEGKIRNAGTHAAGVVIAPGEVTDYVPLYQPPKSKNVGNEVATQYSMNELEMAGLLKMDFLGLRTLSIIDQTLEMIERNHGIKIEIDDIDFEDEKTFDLISSGNTLAVFQFESQGMQEYLRQLKPKNLEELTAMNALYRPGPMDNIPEFIDRKFGKKPITYLHPIMERSLKNTYGIIVYQEQVMQLVRDIAGFSLGQADLLRRAMGKKKKSVMDEQKPGFVKGAAKNNINEKLALEIFDLIYKFADYGFNKSHSLAYSYLAYQTAWLKAHYPAEFLAANMSAEINDQDKIVALIDEAKKFEIRVLPPDINRSLATFNAVDNTIFFGMAAIKNVGIQAVESIVRARETEPILSFFDLTARVDTRLINRRALEALIYAGAFSSLKNSNRAALFQSIDSALEYGKAMQDSSTSGMDSLFGSDVKIRIVEPAVPEIPEWPEKLRLEREKEVLNFYVSGHPLTRYSPHVNSFATLKLGDKESSLIGKEVRVCGMVTEVRKRLDKKNQTIAFIKLEDLTGKGECIFWSDSFSRYQNILVEEAVVMCIGKSESGTEGIKVIVDEVLPIDHVIRKLAKGYKLWISREEEALDKLKMLNKYFCKDPAAKSQILFNITDPKSRYWASYLANDVNIPLNDDITSRLIDMFGARNVGFIPV